MCSEHTSVLWISGVLHTGLRYGVACNVHTARAELWWQQTFYSSSVHGLAAGQTRAFTTESSLYFWSVVLLFTRCDFTEVRFIWGIELCNLWFSSKSTDYFFFWYDVSVMVETLAHNCVKERKEVARRFHNKWHLSI